MSARFANGDLQMVSSYRRHNNYYISESTHTTSLPVTQCQAQCIGTHVVSTVTGTLAVFRRTNPWEIVVQTCFFGPLVAK